MYSQSQINPMVTFRNAENEAGRGTIVNLQRKSLVMEVYNPYSIVQVSEVLSEFTVRFGTSIAYIGKAVVISMVNTGLTAVVSITLIDEWCDLNDVLIVPGAIREKARQFILDWTNRIQIRRDYQLIVNETRTYLSDISRWIDQVDLSETLPKADGQLRADVFFELVIPLVEKMKFYFDELNGQASLVEEEQSPAHRSFVQAALHPLLLRAPFVFRAYSKPLGYAGDYQMVNQMLNDPRKGPSTYFQMVNTAFLQTSVVVAHRNRIDLLVDFLNRIAERAMQSGKVFRVLNVGCGPAVEIQRFILSHPHPELLAFDLVDFSEETLEWSRQKLSSILKQTGKPVPINYVHDSVHHLLKRDLNLNKQSEREFDAVYCAGLFDYLSDKVCSRLTAHFAARMHDGGELLITNVHSNNPEKFSMSHILEWHLVYRDEKNMEEILPRQCKISRIYTEATKVNVFAEAVVAR